MGKEVSTTIRKTKGIFQIFFYHTEEEEKRKKFKVVIRIYLANIGPTRKL
jgi:hypothetical protein